MKQVDFEKGRISANILQTALPMLVAQILNLLYSIVDRIYIGRIPGEGTAALGGIGLCFPVITLITAFTNLYGGGGAPLFAIARGRGREEEAAHIQDTAFRLELMTGVPLLLFIFFFARPLLTLFGASEHSLPYALGYLRIYIWGTLFSMIATGMNPFINAQGFPRIGMFTVVIGAVSNILLDPVFIFVLGMGVQGAALATILSQALSAAFVLRFLMGKHSPALFKLRISRRDLLPALHTSLQIISLGMASFVMLFTNGLVTAVANHKLMATGGELYISVMTILSSLRQVVEVPIYAIAEGSSPVISYNYGASKASRVRESILIMSLAAGTYTLAGWILMELFPTFFLGIFTGDSGLITASLPAMRLYFLAFIFMSLQYSAQATFRALGKKKQAIIFSLLRKAIIVVPLTILLPHFLAPPVNGVFLAEPVSNILGGTAAFITMLLTVLPELKNLEHYEK